MQDKELNKFFVALVEAVNDLGMPPQEKDKEVYPSENIANAIKDTGEKIAKAIDGLTSAIENNSLIK